MAAGAGLPVTAIFATLLLLASLIAMGMVENRLGWHLRIMNFRITAPNATNIAERVRQIVQDAAVEARRWHMYTGDSGFVVEFDAGITFPQERTLRAKLSALDAHCEVRPVRPVAPL